MEKSIIKNTQGINAMEEKEKYQDWIALNNANKKLRSYKFSNMTKKLSKELGASINSYLKAL